MIDRAVNEEEDDSRLKGCGAGRFFLRSDEVLVRHLDSKQSFSKMFSKIGKLFDLSIEGRGGWRRILDFHLLFVILFSFFKI
jgi:hypothetical protein